MNKKEIYVSFNMIVQNEELRIRKTLENIKDVADEIIIVDGGSYDDTVKICQEYTDKIFFKHFDGNFSEQKNFANSKCRGRWIFNIDADEILNDNLKKDLITILQANEGIDILYLARRNIIKDLDLSLATKWRWTIDKDGDINYPDFQGRIFKNSGIVRWVGNVHERIGGYQHFGKLPVEKDTGYFLIHDKVMSRQIKQNEYYETLINNG